jgi:hypothetical protein
VTSAIPASGGVQTGVSFADSGGNSTVASITGGATLAGSITVNATGPTGSGTPQDVTFGINAGNALIPSSPITTGDTLSGSIVIGSTDGKANASDSVNLADYQGLGSSNAIIVNQAAAQLQTDINTAIGGSTGKVFSASVSGGRLMISTSTYNYVHFIGSGNTETSTTPLGTGNLLTGHIQMTGDGGVHHTNLDMANYQGLTSSSAPVVQAALTQLGSDWTTGIHDGSTYTVSINGSGDLIFTSSNLGASLNIYAVDTFYQGAPLSIIISNAQQASVTPPTTTPEVVSVAGVATSNLQNYLRVQLGNDYTVS